MACLFPLFSCGDELEKNQYWELQNTELGWWRKAAGYFGHKRVLCAPYESNYLVFKP